VTVHWTMRALDEMREVMDIITCEKYPEDAARWVNGLQELTENLSDFPESGRISRVGALAHHRIREIIYGRYRVFYVIVDDTCEIISLRHGAMNIKSPSDL